MQRFIFWLICLIAAVFIGVNIKNNPAYVLIMLQHHTVETRLWFAILVAVIAFIIIYLLLRIIYLAINSPSQLKNWWLHRQVERAKENNNRGLLLLAQGEWFRAEKYLLKSVKMGQEPIVSYLALAYAAQAQGKDGLRNQYLHRAHDIAPQEQLAIGLTQAQLQMMQKQYEQALAILRQLRQQHPKHHFALYLLYQIYYTLHDWQALIELMPALQKAKILAEEQWQQLQFQASEALLLAAKDVIDLKKIWQQQPSVARKNLPLTMTYVEQLLKWQDNDEAAKLIESYLKKSWSDDLVYLYAEVCTDPQHQLAIAEKWYKRYPKNPAVLYTFGCICMRNELWGRAKDYLLQTLSIDKNAKTFVKLCQLMEEMDQPQEAIPYYHQAIQLLTA